METKNRIDTKVQTTEELVCKFTNAKPSAEVAHPMEGRTEEQLEESIENLNFLLHNVKNDKKELGIQKLVNKLNIDLDEGAAEVTSYGQKKSKAFEYH